MTKVNTRESTGFRMKISVKFMERFAVVYFSAGVG
jgi:hypothetical protein